MPPIAAYGYELESTSGIECRRMENYQIITNEHLHRNRTAVHPRNDRTR